MQRQSPVDIADRVSRSRAFTTAALAVLFIVVQLMARPFFRDGAGATSTEVRLWAVNVLVLLAFLATGGGLARNRQVRALLNDQVSLGNRTIGIVAGYWVAMAIAMALFTVPAVHGLSTRQAVYLIVSPSLVVALLAFSWLELRAHRDA